MTAKRGGEYVRLPIVAVQEALDAVDSWRGLFDGAHPIDHVLAVSQYRVETLTPRSPLRLLSTGSDSIHVPRLSEEGVRAFVDACLHSGVQNTAVLTTFLTAETSGNPLFLRTLLSTLVSMLILTLPSV